MNTEKRKNVVELYTFIKETTHVSYLPNCSRYSYYFTPSEFCYNGRTNYTYAFILGFECELLLVQKFVSPSALQLHRIMQDFVTVNVLTLNDDGQTDLFKSLLQQWHLEWELTNRMFDM